MLTPQGGYSLRHAFSVPPPSMREAVKSPLPRGCQHAGGMLAYSRRLSGGASATELATSETCTKAETNIENTELNSHNRINFGDSIQDKLICFKFGMLFFGHVIAKCLYATGRRPFALPHRRNYVPAGHPPTNASLFSFSRGVAYSLPPSRYACHLPQRGRLYCTSTREFTVVAEPIRDKALHRIKCFMII